MKLEFTPHASSSGLFTAAGGYAIRRDGDESPAYWIAYRPGSNGKHCINPQHEIGAGAGDQGWLKCVRLCELEERSGRWDYAASNVNHAAPGHSCNDPQHCAGKVATVTTPAAPSSNNNAAPQQRGLEL